MIRLLPIDAASYLPSRLHGEQRIWPETNCYADLWIELLHGLGLDAVPALAFTLSVDFEGDQWQFFKFALEDLWTLYGLDVAEMNPWRGVEHHVEEQLSMGRLLIVEVDSWYLPDTAGVAYRLEHTKTSIVANMIDRDSRRLGYFHGGSYFELEGDDYAGMLLRGHDNTEAMPPYVELVKLDGLERPDDSELLRRALRLTRRHLGRRPITNPVLRFGKRFEQDLGWLRSEELATFHLYAFATLRQFGSCCELAASLCDWLTERKEPLREAAARFTELSSDAKTAQFKAARLARGRQGDVGTLLDGMGEQWDAAMAILEERYGR